MTLICTFKFTLCNTNNKTEKLPTLKLDMICVNMFLPINIWNSLPVHVVKFLVQLHTCMDYTDSRVVNVYVAVFIDDGSQTIAEADY